MVPFKKRNSPPSKGSLLGTCMPASQPGDRNTVGISHHPYLEMLVVWVGVGGKLLQMFLSKCSGSTGGGTSDPTLYDGVVGTRSNVACEGLQWR